MGWRRWKAATSGPRMAGGDETLDLNHDGRLGEAVVCSTSDQRSVGETVLMGFLSVLFCAECAGWVAESIDIQLL